MSFEVTDSDRNRLIEALSEQFSVEELARMLSSYSPDLCSEFPTNVPKPDYVVSVVDGLRRRGMIDDRLFGLWLKDRPLRASEISALRDRILVRGEVSVTGDLGDRIVKHGDPDQFRLVCKVAGANFVKSTKAMEVPGGCVVQVSTREERPGAVAVAEAVSFVPRVRLEPNGDGTFRLVAVEQQP